MDHPTQNRTIERLQWFGRTDRGKVRPNNEDSFIALQFDAREVFHLGKTGEGLTGKFDYAFAVSDGMGGAMAGEFASRIAVEKIIKMLPRSFRQTALGLEAGWTEVLAEIYDQIHKALSFVGASYAECHGMETTLSLCWFTPGMMYFGHVGDSRIYYFPAHDGGMKQLSEDDTHVGWLLRQGKINEREARTHPRRSVLQKALGGGHQFIEPQVGAVACEPGDIFLLCTDGLVDGHYDARLHEALRPAEPAAPDANPAEILVDSAIESSGRDNTTALVIRVL